MHRYRQASGNREQRFPRQQQNETSFSPEPPIPSFLVESENRWVRLRVSNAALRTIDKNGIDTVLADLRARGEL